jgi:uncharacterized membrane protein
LPGGPHHSAAALISRDGSIVVGTGYSERGAELFRWTEKSGFTALGELPGGEFASEPFGMSPDASTIVGKSSSSHGIEAFRWTSKSGVEALGDLPGGSFESIAFDVSADGARVVGYGTSERGSEAFLWERDGGLRNLRELALAAGAKIADGWLLASAAAISDDGRVIVGHGTAPDGTTQAWRIELPAAR